MGKMRELVAIVTGASRGLGRAIAREFAREGAKVVICARPRSPSGLPGTIQETAELIRSDGGEVLSIPCDVTNQEQVQGLVQQVMERYERIDVLFNNAGIMVLGQTLVQIEPDQWDQVMGVIVVTVQVDVAVDKSRQHEFTRGVDVVISRRQQLLRTNGDDLLAGNGDRRRVNLGRAD